MISFEVHLAQAISEESYAKLQPENLQLFHPPLLNFFDSALPFFLPKTLADGQLGLKYSWLVLWTAGTS